MDGRGRKRLPAVYVVRKLNRATVVCGVLGETKSVKLMKSRPLILFLMKDDRTLEKAAYRVDWPETS